MPIPDEYQTWFTELCKEAELNEVEQAIEEGGLVINEIPFFFVKGIVDEEGRLIVQGIIDQLPQTGAMEILCRILEIQMILAGPSGPVFGLERSSNALMLMTTVKPDEVSPKAMLALLRLLAPMARVWRETLHAAGPVQLNSQQKKMMEKFNRS